MRAMIRFFCTWSASNRGRNSCEAQACASSSPAARAHDEVDRTRHIMEAAIDVNKATSDRYDPVCAERSLSSQTVRLKADAISG